MRSMAEIRVPSVIMVVHGKGFVTSMQQSIRSARNVMKKEFLWRLLGVGRLESLRTQLLKNGGLSVRNREMSDGGIKQKNTHSKIEWD